MFRTHRTPRRWPITTSRGRLLVEALEGRQLMTAASDHLVIMPVAATTQLQAGVAARYTVEAVDAQGNVDTNFADHVDFRSNDPNAILPQELKLPSGTATVSVIFTTAGQQTVTVRDLATRSINATSAGVAVVPGSVVALTISAPSNVEVNAPATLTVTAIDAYGNTVTGDADTVKLATKASGTNLPGSLSLVNGVATTTVAFTTPGKKTIAATDASTSGITGASASIVAGQIIQGTVFLDQTASGKFASGAPLLAGRVVYLDLKQDGRFDAGDPTATTDSQGHFAFSTYAAGSAVVREDLTQDASLRNVATETLLQSGGTIAIGAVPISAVVPLPVFPNPFGATTGTSAAANYVESLYRSILGRNASSSEINNWTGLLQTTITQAQVANMIVGSAEHLTAEVDAYYEHFLSHAPDPTGLQHWVGQLTAGTMTETQVVESILDSAEYQADHATTTSSGSIAFVPALYLDVLGRQADPAGLAATDALVAAGMTPAQVIARIVESPEATDAIIDSFYSALLRSQPDATAALESAAVQAGAQTPAMAEVNVLTSDLHAVLVAAMPTVKSVPIPTTAPADRTWYSTHLKTPAIAATVQADMLAHGQLTRRDMLNLFKQVQRSGKVTSNELHDLKAIIKNMTVVAMTPSVRNLSSKLVYGSSANKSSGTQTLGDLKVGSSSAHLGKLVNKWFLGLDRPTPTSTDDSGNVTTYKYAKAAGPLFVGQPSYHQVQQGFAGDCYFMASLASLTLHSPEQTIGNMITDNKDGTYTVRYYDNNVTTNVATPDYVTVDRWLPKTTSGSYAFANNNYKLSDKHAALWAPLIEKAYAQWTAEGHNLALDSDQQNNSYDINGIGAGSNQYNGAIEALTGQSGYVVAEPPTSPYDEPKVQFAKFAAAFADGSNIVCASKSTPGDDHIDGNHVYAVVAVNAATQSITLYNPWGLDGGDGTKAHIAGLVTLSWSKLEQNYDMLAYRPSTLS